MAVLIKCGICGRESRPSQNWTCPNCRKFFKKIIFNIKLQDWIMRLAGTLGGAR